VIRKQPQHCSTLRVYEEVATLDHVECEGAGGLLTPAGHFVRWGGIVGIAGEGQDRHG